MHCQKLDSGESVSAICEAYDTGSSIVYDVKKTETL